MSLGGVPQSSTEGGERAHYAGGMPGGEAPMPPQQPPTYINQSFDGGMPATPMRSSQYAYPPSGVGLTSLQIRQEKEAELRANDQHWQRRVNQLEESHQKINEMMEKEYIAAVSVSLIFFLFYMY